MTNFTTSRKADTPSFTYTIGRKIIMKIKVFFVIFIHRINNLFIPFRTQCGYHQCLSFSTGKKCRPMSPRQDIWFNGNRTNFCCGAPVASLSTCQNLLPKIGFKFIINQFFYNFFILRKFIFKGFQN